MKTLKRTAKLVAADYIFGDLPGVTSYIFNEYADTENSKGLTYEKIVNGESVIVKSNKNEYNTLVADARKALYQKFVRGIGRFEVKILIKN